MRAKHAVRTYRFPAAIPAALLGLMLACPAVSAAQDHPCAVEPDPVRRLACYDAAFPLSTETREAAEAAARQAGIDEFGREAAPAAAAPAAAPAAADPDRIESRVAKVSYDSAGRTISMENGQVWRLTEGDSRGHMRVGERIGVRKAAMGTFMLITEAGVNLRARRVR